ncbi:hypothetical protein ACQEPB_00555 [Novosphingobium fluoreni]|uniref:hypothetical protein n=1 Tax=Novosphingobium fluoreni TaxID=1391222 RepID=UPI003D9FB4F4
MDMQALGLPQDPDSIRQLATWLMNVADETAPTSVTAREPKEEPRPASIETFSAKPLPDARHIRKILRHRDMRRKFFPDELFGEPAWDMLLDLTAACVENKRVSVTSLCLAAGVPPTTALRWIAMLVERNIFVREADQTDRRRAFVRLSENGMDAVAAYFAKAGAHGHL